MNSSPIGQVRGLKLHIDYFKTLKLFPFGFMSAPKLSMQCLSPISSDLDLELGELVKAENYKFQKYDEKGC